MDDSSGIPFKVATSVVCDYFHRLGGAGRYSGFEPWHCFALVAIVLKRISYEELTDAGIYINERLWHGCDGIYQTVREHLSSKEKEADQFLAETTDYMQRKAIRYGSYEEYRGWVTFNWYLRNRERGCVWRHDASH